MVLANFKSMSRHLPDLMFPLDLHLLPTDEKGSSELLGAFPVVLKLLCLEGQASESYANPVSW